MFKPALLSAAAIVALAGIGCDSSPDTEASPNYKTQTHGDPAKAAPAEATMRPGSERTTDPRAPMPGQPVNPSDKGDNRQTVP